MSKTEQKPLIQLEHVSLSYGAGREVKMVLADAGFKVFPGEVVGLSGESGSGKSSLAYVLCGLKEADQGLVISPFERISYVIQNPAAAFDPLKTIGYTLRETRRAWLRGQKAEDTRKKALNRTITDLLPEFGIREERLEDYPHMFSGGELQRLSILRALLREPEILILDEATAMLDVLVQARILDFLRRLRERYGLTYIVISHDRALLRHFCGRAYRLEGLKLTEEVFQKEADKQADP